MISQIFRIFAKYSERYCDRSVARAIRYQWACLWDIFQTCFSILGKVLSSEFFYFPPLSITVVNLTSREMSQRRKSKKEKKEKKECPALPMYAQARSRFLLIIKRYMDLHNLNYVATAPPFFHIIFFSFSHQRCGKKNNMKK